MVNEDTDSPDGGLIFDETCFIKKGNDSVGVAKQCCGTIGKVENCQASVFAAYASPSGYALMEKWLFVPEKWFCEEYELRRIKCRLPESVTFKTKPQLVAEMLNDLVEEAAVPFKYVAADSLY